MFSIQFEFEQRSISVSQVDTGDTEMQMSQQPPRQTLALQIVDQPPEKAVYKLNVKPNPSVQLIGEHLGPREGELFVVPILLRCDTYPILS